MDLATAQRLLRRAETVLRSNGYADLPKRIFDLREQLPAAFAALAAISSGGTPAPREPREPKHGATYDGCSKCGFGAGCAEIVACSDAECPRVAAQRVPAPTAPPLVETPVNPPTCDEDTHYWPEGSKPELDAPCLCGERSWQGDAIQRADVAEDYIAKLRGPLLWYFGTTDPELLADVWKQQARSSTDEERPQTGEGR